MTWWGDDGCDCCHECKGNEGEAGTQEEANDEEMEEKEGNLILVETEEETDKEEEFDGEIKLN